MKDRKAWACAPHVVVLLASAATMIFELLAGRLIGRHLGSSVYTWTSVIGVMMAGMSLGNYWGGRWADRHPPGRLMSLLLLGSAAACVLSVLLNYLLAAWVPLPILNWPLRILVTVLIVFALPAVMLGTLTPVAARMAVQQTAQAGGAIGAVYAMNALGSIGGTFLTGYYLVMVAGVTALVLATAAGLLLLGAAFLLLYARRADAVPAVVCVLQAEPSMARALPLLRRCEPQIIVFFSAACLMAVEIVASRLMARYVGNSIYTWTAVIGVVLTGMMLGYAIGGRLADRWPPERFLGLLCTFASVSCLVALLLNRKFECGLLPKELSWPSQVFIGAACCFLPPALFLGAISPGAAKLALGHSTQVGRTIGTVYAWGTVGSIAGTLLSGFFLIAALGSNGVLLGAAVLMALAGVAVSRRRRLSILWAVLLAPFILCAVLPESVAGTAVRRDLERLGLRMPVGNAVFARESNYQYVRVFPHPEKPDVRTMVLDHLVHGYIREGRPAHLEYAYEMIYAVVTERFAKGKPSVAAFFLGGGSFTLPRWMQVLWPDAHIEVAEIDPVVVDANYETLWLPRDARMKIHIGDARNVIDSLRPDTQFDFFYGDVFTDFSVPWHLTTLEFYRKVSAHLTPDGAYMMNVIDSHESGLFVGSCYATLKQVFKHVYIFCTERSGVQRQVGTFVLVASNVPIDVSAWRPGHSLPVEMSALTPENLEDLMAKCGRLVLTDDLAPVENLLEPVVGARAR